MLGPTTDADRRRWQERAYKLLGELLEIGWRQELPPIDWRVMPTMKLVGQPCGDNKRADWEAWVVALELDRWLERSSNGRTHLHAVAQNWRLRHVNIAIFTDVWEEEPDADG
jgi:hypothetical protein